MAKTSKKGNEGIAIFTKATSPRVMIAVLAFIVGAGGTYGGYTVYQGPKLPFDDQLHTVKRVIDGDTFVIADEDGKDIRVRMIGIDAPEIGTCGAQEAKEVLAGNILNRDVRLRKNLEGTDDLGRLLRYVIIPGASSLNDDTLVSQRLLEEGIVYQQDEAFSDMYRDLHRKAENDAEENNRGIWATCPHPVRAQTALREQDNAPHKPGCDIKGNISEKSYGKIYFTPGCPNYSTIKVDTRKGEQYFCSESDAQKAGFTKSASCENVF